MNESKLTVAGAIKSNGCTIHRSLDKWVVSRDRTEDVLGEFLGEVDTLGEAETLASQARTANVAKVSEARAKLAQIEADAYTDMRMRMGERGEA